MIDRFGVFMALEGTILSQLALNPKVWWEGWWLLNRLVVSDSTLGLLRTRLIEYAARKP